MQSLTKPCQSCNKPMNGGMYRANHICPYCSFAHEGGKRSKASATKAPVQEVPVAKTYSAKPKDPATEYLVTEHEDTPTETAPSTVSEAPVEPATAPATPVKPAAPVAKADASGANVVLTTKSQAQQTVLAVMGEVSAECTLSIALTPELFKDGKFVGQKSAKVLAALKQGKQNALAQLRQTAETLDANMVTDVAVKNGMKMVGTESANITVNATGNAIVAELEGCEA